MFGIEENIYIVATWYWICFWCFPIILPLYLLFWSNIIPKFWSNPATCKKSFFFNGTNRKELAEPEKHKYLESLKFDNKENVDVNKVLVIGAGFSGIATMGALTRHGIPFECVEKDSQIGGNWASGVYNSVHIISSKKTTELKDYPMPEDYPDFPSAKQMLDYLNSYAEHFNINKHIQLSTEVLHVDALGEGRTTKWNVIIKKNDIVEERVYQSIIICTGHHWDKRFPKIPGKFSGEMYHSKDYKTLSQLKDKKILVVGNGNSACDIAVDGANVGTSCSISMRTGPYFIPRSMFGIPSVDTLKPYMPVFLQILILRILIFIIHGSNDKYNIPLPKDKPFDKHPTVNSSLLDTVQKGKLNVVPTISKFIGDKNVLFDNGQVEEYDTIIFATGYYTSLPIIDHLITKNKNNYPQLLLNLLPTNYANCYVIGLGQVRFGAGNLYNIQSEVTCNMIKQQPYIRVPICDIAKALKFPLTKTSKHCESDLLDPHKVWKEYTIILRLFISLLPILEILLTRFGILNSPKLYNIQSTSKNARQLSISTHGNYSVCPSEFEMAKSYMEQRVDYDTLE